MIEPKDPMSMEVIYFWKDEPVACPPATRNKNISFLSIKRATLHVELEPKWRLDKVTFNIMSWRPQSNTFETDVTQYIRNGENHVKLDYSNAWDCVLGGVANANVYVVIEKEIYSPVVETPTLEDVSKKIEGKIKEAGIWGIAYLIVIALILIAIAFIILRLGITGETFKGLGDFAKSIEKGVKKAIG